MQNQSFYVLALVLIFIAGCSTQPVVQYVTTVDADNAFDNAVMYHYGFQGKTRSAQKADEWYSKAILDGDLEHMNCYAYFLATSPDENYRNGKKAKALMDEVFGKVEVQFHHKDTLAAVFAELGQFDKAAEIQEQAINDMPADVDANRLQKYRMRLDLYKTSKPWRE